MLCPKHKDKMFYKNQHSAVAAMGPEPLHQRFYGCPRSHYTTRAILAVITHHYISGVHSYTANKMFVAYILLKLVCRFVTDTDNVVTNQKFLLDILCPESNYFLRYWVVRHPVQLRKKALDCELAPFRSASLVIIVATHVI